MTRIPEQPSPPFPRQPRQDRPGLDAMMDPRPKHGAAALPTSGKLRDQVALITGGDSGIGAAVAVLFAKEGADVAIVHLPEERPDADHVRRHVEEAGRRFLGIPGDLKDSAFCKEAVERTVEAFGRLDILVNNAAVMYQRADLEEISDQELDEVYRTNVFAYYYMVRAALPHLKPGSCIINCGSVAGMEGNPDLLGYAETKGANHTFTKSLAARLIGRGIRVNCVAPGPVWTPLNASSRTPEQLSTYGAETDGVPLGRPAQPEEIAPSFLFLASGADSGYINGEIIALYGGEVHAR